MSSIRPDDTHNSPFDSETPLSPYNAAWAIKRRINQKLKQLTLQQVSKVSSLEVLEQLDKQLNEAVKTRSEDRELWGRKKWEKDEEDHGPYPVLSREMAPLAGQSSVVAPPLHIWFDREAKKAYGKATLDWLYEGPPFCVHGGVVASLFDEFLGCTQVLTGEAGATGSLTVRYHLPTPLNVELNFEGRIKSVEGRKLIMVGELYANGKKTASAEGLFITFPEGVDNLAERKN